MPLSRWRTFTAIAAWGQPLTIAILDGSREVALPRTMATLAIAIVFIPVAFLYGVSKYLFIPLALAVCLLADGLLLPVLHAGADAVALLLESESHSDRGLARG
jgi:Cu/Ag efflux pump CusA